MSSSPARIELEAAEAAEATARAFAAGATSVWEAMQADVTTRDTRGNSRAAAALGRALENLARLEQRRELAARAYHDEFEQLRARIKADRAALAPEVATLPAGVIRDSLALYVPTVAELAEQRTAALEQLEAAALPQGAPGAWIRDAIAARRETTAKAMREQLAHGDREALADVQNPDDDAAVTE